MLVRSADCSCDWLARYAQRRQTEIKNELSAIRGAAKKPQIAAKYGVDVKDAQVLQNLIKQMTAEQKRWANFGIHPDLVKEANNAVMLAMGLKSQEQVELENREARVAAGTDNLLGFGMDQDGNAVMDGEDGMRSDGATGVLFGDEVGIQDGLWANTNVLGQEDAQSKSNVSASLAEGTNFSLAEAKERGLFQDGVMVAGNGVVTEPGVSFSTINDLLHASGARFNEFDLSKIGSGTGIQIYGFGVYLAQAHDLKHNRRYWEKAKEKYGQAFNYRVSFNADESELVVWDRRTPEALLDAAVSEFGVERDAVGFVDDFYFDLARRFGGKVEGARMASEWLYGHGVKGVKTGLEEDAFIVAFNERDVRITAVNELDYWSEKEGWRNVAPAFDAVARDVDLAVSHSLAEGVRAEMESIKEQAVVNGTFMRAPNGAETKLTEGQWLSVRTGAFKDWFGDWENDAANASKVVDENGEPMVVYHGTWRSGFTVFGKGEKRFAGSPDGAYFFSPNKNVALAYSGFEGREVDLGGGIQEKESRAIYSSFLNMRNPKVVDFGGSSYMHEVYGVKGVDGNEYWKDDEGHVFYTDDDARAYAEEHGLEIEDGKVQGKIRTTDDEAQRAKAEGYDGIIIRNVRDATDWWGKEDITDDDYVAFEPNQIKSATQNRGTFDSSNPDITFSVTDAKEQGLFRDGVMVTDNAIILEPGVSFSTIDNLYHASPADFRKFDLSYLNSGEGNQAFGWGLYFAESEGVNRDYWNKFASLMRANAPKQLKVGKLVINVKADSWQERTDEVKKLARHINPKLTESALNEIGMASYDSYWGRLHGGIESLFNALDSPINSKESITARKERGLQRLRREVEYFQDGVNDARERYERELQSYDAKQEEFRLRLRLLDEAREEFVRNNNPQSKTGKKMVEGKFKNKRVRWEERSNSYNFHPDSYNAVNVKKETQWLQNELRKEPGQDAKEALTESENKLAIAQLLLKHFEKRGSVQAITQETPTPMNYKTSFNAEDEELLKWDEVEPRAEYIVRTIKEEKGRNINKNAKTGRGLYHELMRVLSPAWKKEEQVRFSSPEWKALKRDAQKKASEWLYAHGVKGIKYLDGNSRRKGEGTYNYVVFNDKDIKITAYSNADHWTMEKKDWTPFHDSTAGFSLVATDGNGKRLSAGTFVARPDGSVDWFVMPKRKGQPAMPVRLLVGEDVSRHKGYGLTHITASRHLDGLWKSTSPERYLSSILANVSELWEISPGRKLLVKGKRPSSWMVLQLVQKDGYYSIITAHPVAPGKKPIGKRIPLTERIAGKNQTRVDRSQRPVNPDAAPDAFPVGQENKAATLASTAGGGSVFGLPSGAQVVNINDVKLHFDDGSSMPAAGTTFSLAEMQTIKDTAVANGTFMKAPNGADTNLTESQWLSVRTGAFKDWFGDWEGDAANASKVVDGNGEPMVVYHGTNSRDFTVFDSGKMGTGGAKKNKGKNLYGDGFYFATDYYTAQGYGKNVFECFLNIKDPAANDLVLSEENDGIAGSVPGSRIFVAFEPNQIKSATDNRGTFDSSNPDITFSVTDAKEQGLFRDGVMVTDNAIILEPGVSFSTIDNLYHASPHDFRKFDLSKIGTGEGAQVYGYGIYLAENKEVNKSYWKQFDFFMSADQDGDTTLFSRRGYTVTSGMLNQSGSNIVRDILHKAFHVDEALLNSLSESSRSYLWSYNRLFYGIRSAQQAVSLLEGNLQRDVEHLSLQEGKIKELQDEIAETKALIKEKGKDAKVKQYGSYGTEIKAQTRLTNLRKEEKQRSQIRDHVKTWVEIDKQVLADIKENPDVEITTPRRPSNYKTSFNAEEHELILWDQYDSGTRNMITNLLNQFEQETGQELVEKEWPAGGGPRKYPLILGKMLCQKLNKHFTPNNPAKTDKQNKLEGKKKASEWLYAHGVKGIKYLDGNSRRKGEGTYNYVVFNDKDIKITAYSNADHWTMDKNAWTPFYDSTAGFSLVDATTFSIVGEKAATFAEYRNSGYTYVDPADGREKAVLDTRGVRLVKERMGISEGGYVDVSLGGALHFPELFRAYPELRGMRVRFYREAYSEVGGYYDRAENCIAVNVSRFDVVRGMVNGKEVSEMVVRYGSPAEILGTLLHEVQHVIQGYEGFAMGSNGGGVNSAVEYIDRSMDQLSVRGDEWAKGTVEWLRELRGKVKSGEVDALTVYRLSSGEQEANVAGGVLAENGVGVDMRGVSGLRLLDGGEGRRFSVPVVGAETELGGITFGGGRFAGLGAERLAARGDWVYDEVVFKMRRAMERSARGFKLYDAEERERGLEMIAEALELVNTLEGFLPHSYGFGLAPYKVWLNFFSLLYGNSVRMDLEGAMVSAMESLPMKGWDDIMMKSIVGGFIGYVSSKRCKEREPGLHDLWRSEEAVFEADVAGLKEGSREVYEGERAQFEWKFFCEHAQEWLEHYGKSKVFRLLGKFMDRVSGQIDLFRKDRILGRVRRVVGSMSPRHSESGRPLRGRMDVESYRRLMDYMRLMEMTEAKYDAIMRHFTMQTDEEVANGEPTQWDRMKGTDSFVVTVADEVSGESVEVRTTKQAFEVYGCFERMSVEEAECSARALGEFIATRRDAWENAEARRREELAYELKPVFEAAGKTDDNAMSEARRKELLMSPARWVLGFFDGCTNGYQFFDSLRRVKPLAGVVTKWRDRLANAEAKVVGCEKDLIECRAKAAGAAIGVDYRKGEYEVAEWVLDNRKKENTGIVLTEQEPDWEGKAREMSH